MVDEGARGEERSSYRLLLWDKPAREPSDSGMEGEDVDENSTQADAWATAVATEDPVKLSKMVLEWSYSEPVVALSLLRRCVALMEEDIAHCVDDPGSPRTPILPPGSTQNPCLDAFTLALNQKCGGKSWYTSTVELQLTSLQLCCACRRVTTLTLTISYDIPRRILAAADAPPPNRKRLCSSRVPRLRAREVRWRLPTAEELRRPVYSLVDATKICFYDGFVDGLEGIVWPERLTQITFGAESRFNRPLDEVAWPASLQHLEFGDKFNQSIDAAGWPSSLQKLTFGVYFNRSIENTKWPTNLLQIEFGSSFNKPIEAVTWPDSVRQLWFGHSFDRPIGNVRWPTSLQLISFGSGFNQSVKGVVWPASLRQIEFGYAFNRPLDGFVWPTSLQQMRFGDAFNQPIEGVAWADSISHLSFGQVFDQPIDRVTWPSSLQCLSFGLFHDHPRNEKYLVSWFNHPIDRARWPTSLRRLSLGHGFGCSLKGLGVWMPNLEELCLLPQERSAYRRILDGVEWPKSLRKLTVFRDHRLESVQIPESVQVVCW